MSRQYYYKTNGCSATEASDPECVCWHDEGTESLDANAAGFFSPVVEDTERGKRYTWRDKPSATPAPAQPEPDMRAICEALGFDPTNHHNAAKCPYCRPAAQPEAQEDEAMQALRGMHRFFQKYPSFVPDLDFIVEIDAAIKRMNAVIEGAAAPAEGAALRGLLAEVMDDEDAAVWTLGTDLHSRIKAALATPSPTPPDAGKGENQS